MLQDYRSPKCSYHMDVFPEQIEDYALEYNPQVTCNNV
jgi:hypothetical protein